MNQDNPTFDVMTEIRGGVGVITLNRPKALNALSLEMIREISAALHDWANDGAVQAVLFVGAGDKAFCAGGDIKSFYRSGMDYRRGAVRLNVASLFFAEEYALNRQIFHYPKPTIAFMDGITMGGGYGIAGHCKHRIATERTVFAMPEVHIGFFPDVGSVYHLHRCPQHFGRYLAMTGTRIEAGDMVESGLADLYMNSGQYSALLSAIEGQDAGNIEGVVDELGATPPRAEILHKHGKEIKHLFQDYDVEALLSRLAEGDGAIEAQIQEVFHTCSPLSVFVTARHLQVLEGKDFDVVIEADLERARNFIKYPDLYEGVRALLIDKDRAPAWDLAGFSDVHEGAVARYFDANL